MTWQAAEIGDSWWAVASVCGPMDETEAGLCADERPGARWPGLVAGPYLDEAEAGMAAEELERVGGRAGRPDDPPDERPGAGKTDF